MRYDDFRHSDNIDDRRDDGGGGMGGGMGIPMGGGGLGIGTIIVLGLLGYAFGIDPRILIGGAEIIQGPSQQQTQRQAPPAKKGAPSDRQGDFVAAVIGSTEDVWGDIFKRNGSQYREPTLQIFSGRADTACGRAGASVGPFYCPADEKVYIDLSFYDELQSRFHAPGDFAQAYVIAHEVGHHVQNLLGTSDKVTQLQRRARSEAQANDLSVRLELQADCYAGVWGFYAKQRDILDPGDLEEALRAASAIGDDRLQREAQGYAVPDSFTHGSSEQRMRWFRAGFDTGDLRRCDTFGTGSL